MKPATEYVIICWQPNLSVMANSAIKYSMLAMVNSQMVSFINLFLI